MQNLAEAVFFALADASTDDATADLVLAALEGSESLDAHLDHGSKPDRPDPAAARTTPDGTYLAGLTVEGFRGIGPKVELRLRPGPGLTVVTGRNGSGKSSLAEAMECALTGSTARWQRKSNAGEFKAKWRNLHQTDPATVALALTQPAIGPATISVRWPRGNDAPDSAEISYQVTGQKKQPATELGWQTALQTYRPILTYDDLGLLLTARPIDLHDSIAKALALDDLHAATALLKQRMDPLTRPFKVADHERTALRAELEQLDDPRATAAAKLIRKKYPDTEALLALATGVRDTDRRTSLTAIADVRLPARDAVEAAALALDQAQADLDGIGAQSTELERRRDALLREALTLHEEFGDGPCPVCEQGNLDTAWHERVRLSTAATDLLRSERTEVERRHDDARRSAKKLLHPMPPALRQSTVELASQHAAAETWASWARPDPSVLLSAHLRNGADPLAAAVEAWQTEARLIADADAERWGPYAGRIAAWTAKHRDAVRDDQKAVALKTALAAALAAEQTLQAERLRPIVEQAKAIWAELRQESNVELVGIELEGSGTERSRRVAIDAVVDDLGTSALSVMSQGELNSLALALFLPRAASVESPFRFLVLDDPVQAMDPTKVEGLAAVLADLATSRQVIVFSHDDRLAQAVRRLPEPATILTVTRDPRSRLAIVESQRPYEHQLGEARAWIRTETIAEETKRRVLPGVLRAAIESATWECYARSQLTAGATLEALETSWQQASTTRARLDLLVGDSARWLRRAPGHHRAVTVCNGGTHRPMTGDLTEAYSDSQALVRDIIWWSS